MRPREVEDEGGVLGLGSGLVADAGGADEDGDAAAIAGDVYLFVGLADAGGGELAVGFGVEGGELGRGEVLPAHAANDFALLVAEELEQRWVHVGDVA